MNYNHDTALTEASRCLMCDNPPCHTGCPSSVNPKLFIRKIRFGDLKGAAKLLRSTNVLAASTAYICPCLSTCGSECISDKLDRAIDISGLQRFVMNCEKDSGQYNVATPVKNRKRVAVIGSGPAGLSCAARLAVSGYDVHVHEKENTLGGQLKLSIPDFRLPSEIVDFEIDFIKKLGVTFHLNSLIKDPTSLKKDGFDAVFVSPGLAASKKLGIAGEDKSGVHEALDFLIRAKKGETFNLGQRVLVIGGGDTAIDAARVAKKMGTEVLMLYRRTQKEMPAYRPDIDLAFAEGIEMWFRVIPTRILGDKKVEGLKLHRVKWQGSGRTAKTFDIEGPEFEIKADSIINAVGQTQESDFNLKQTSVGSVHFDRNTLMVTDGIFVGGDFAFGAGTAVAAIGSGAKAADEIDRFCQNPSAFNQNTKDKNLELGCSCSELKAVSYYQKADVDLSVNFCGLTFENPFILAAAPPTDELEMLRHGLKAGWAGAVLKTTSVEGTPVPLKYPMMSSIDYHGKRINALGNIDLISEYHIDVVEKRVRILKKEFPQKIIIASIMGSQKEDWQSLVKRLSDAGADMIECSFSCPQGSLGAKPGQMLSQDPVLTEQVVKWVKEAAQAHSRNIPVVIKITPHVTDVVELAHAVKAGGADAICASNTIQSLMGVDLENFIPYPNVNGKSTYSGMSGPAIKPITLKVISEISKKCGIAITGTGGPVNWRDAVEFMLCGASTVQFCTAVMHYGYDIIDDLKSGITEYLRMKNIKHVSELTGKSLPFITSHDELPYQHKIISKIDTQKCIQDDLCFIACRDGGHMAIALDEKRNPVVDQDQCVGCALCSLVCPVSGCIEMVKKS